MTDSSWGKWTFNPKNGCLEYPLGAGGTYEVPVSSNDDATQTLDWIFQVNEKTWASSDDLGHLVRAIYEVRGR